MKMRILLAIVLIAFDGILAQSANRMTRSQYFETYKNLAVLEMKRSGVPASITLAQGALESGDGNSRLARNGNNHFGIKCHNDWTGKRIYEDDDRKNECFRKYKTVEDSYRDHSDYLRSKTRYAFLFDLQVTDYKGWARGLKKAGYATSPIYAHVLIKIIEEYNLHRYDQMEGNAGVSKRRHAHPSAAVNTTRPILERNRVKYVVGKPGDTFESLTRELGKLPFELPQYNDLSNPPDSIKSGQVIYIQPKRNKADVASNTHLVKSGETMYTISQLYAIKLSRLYYLNNLQPGTSITAGMVLQLRKPVKRSLPRPDLGEPAEELNDEEIEINLNID